MSLTRERIAALPKVSLHDHLDGGLRPGTVIELADEVGWELPSRDPQALGDWFFEAASSGSLERYLETFAHTTAVMQTTEQLRRVAREYVVDLAADGVVYAETRWAPGQHLRAGLSLPDTVEAVADGLAEGMSLCRDAGTPIVVGQIVSMMRHLSPDTAIAELALRYADRGVVGVDLAGAEAGHPAGLFREAYDMIHRYGGHATVHAGEAAGVESIREAVEICGAERIGHGVRLVDDLDLSAATPRLGPLATLVRARELAMNEGVQFVYTGNVRHRAGDTTFCPQCHADLIERDWYAMRQYRLTPKGHCPDCGAAIAGRYAEKAGTFGSKRIPIAIRV